MERRESSSVCPRCVALRTPSSRPLAAFFVAPFTTTTVFGTAVDITLSELTLETFFPADAATAVALRKLAG